MVAGTMGTSPKAPLVALALAAVCVKGLTEEDHACPASDPYSTEDNPFGWPLSPADWSWTRPDCWNRTHLICGGLRQSPIDVNLGLNHCGPTEKGGPNGALAEPGVVSYTTATVPDKVHVSSYMGTGAVQGQFGHINVYDGNTTITYEAVQIHLAAPSLHSLNGEYFDAEMMVFHKRQGAANMFIDGMIVSMLYRHSSNSSKLFEEFGFHNNHNDEVHLAPNWDLTVPINLASEITPALSGASYFYNGSIPVPPCTETMKWIVLDTPRSVGEAQTRQLARHIEWHTGGGVQHRPAQRRDLHGGGARCRRVVMNSLNVGGNHEEATCEAAKSAGKGLRSARCWNHVDRCYNKRYSAADLATADAVTTDKDGPNVHHGEKIVHYKAVNSVRVTTSAYSLDAVVGVDEIMQDDGHGNFGHLLLNGHIFFARSISVKPMSQHTLNGKYYVGELQIEHVLFGDTFGQNMLGYHRDLHKVMVSIFLKLGRENPLLRALSVKRNKHSIRDGVPYLLENTNFDLNELLKPSLDGKWWWYSSNSTRRGCGSSVRYMVFETPLEVNLEQLNCLTLSVSGMESSQTSKPVPKGYLWQEHLPTEAVELNETDCGTLPKTDWKYGQSHPHWEHGNERCWATGYPICGAGKRQSPVDIPKSDLKVGDDNFLAKCSWRPISQLNVTNTGHNIQVNSDQMGYVTYIGPDGFPEYYHIVQFHLHMPSEHMIGGRQYAAELHIVHKRQIHVGNNADDDLLVVGIMFDLAGENSSLLDQLFPPEAESKLQQRGLHPKHFLAGGKVVDEFDEKTKIDNPVDLMRAMGHVLEGPFYRYDGSLTTPPCSEAVKWFVFGTPLTMSQTQWLSFKALYPNPENNRPIQPLNDRVVALNSFEDSEPVQHEFYLNRHRGRSRQEAFPRSETLILVPICFTVVFTIFIMAALFQREDRKVRCDSAGGLEQRRKLGKSAYDHLN